MLNNTLLVLITLILCACKNSPPKEYFALSASAADFNITKQSLANQKPVNHIIGVGPVIIPEYLQHTKIGYWKTVQQLILLDNHYWAEPLERGIARVLTLELQAQHSDWRVIQHPWSNNQQPRHSLRIDIQRLDAFADHAVIEANIDWINQQTKTVTFSQHIKQRVDSRANSAAIAQAFSHLLQQTAHTINPPDMTDNSQAPQVAPLKTNN